MMMLPSFLKDGSFFEVRVGVTSTDTSVVLVVLLVAFHSHVDEVEAETWKSLDINSLFLLWKYDDKVYF